MKELMKIILKGKLVLVNQIIGRKLSNCIKTTRVFISQGLALLTLASEFKIKI